MIGCVIVAVGTFSTLYTIVAAVYWLIRPGETELDHPKRMILRNDR
jgi:hypothetical protein